MVTVVEDCGHDFGMAGSTSIHSTRIREAIWFSLLLAVVLVVTIGAIVLFIDPPRASWFSDLFKMAVDLGQCSMSLSRPLIGNVLLALISGSIAMILLALSLMEIYTSRLRLRPHGMLLLGVAWLAAILLVPSASGDGTWSSGPRWLRMTLDDACQLSEGVVFYRIYAVLIFHALLAWLAILAGVLLKQRISESPPVARISGYGRGATRVEAPQDIVEQIPMPVRVVLLAMAALAIVVYGASLKFSVSRLYHHFTWIEQPATIVELGSLCIVQSREGGVWKEVLRTDCTPEESRRALSDFARADPKRRLRVVRQPQATLEMQLPRGDTMISRVEDYFFLPPTPAKGERFVLLRDPGNPRKLDRTFDIQDAGKTFGRLLIVTFATIAIYLLWWRSDVRQSMRAAL